MKKLTKTFSLIIFSLSISIFTYFIYTHLKQKEVNKIIVKNFDYINPDSLVTIKIDHDLRVFISNKFSNVNSWSRDLENAYNARINDTLLMLKIKKDTPKALIYEILLEVKKMNKKVVIITE